MDRDWLIFHIQELLYQYRFFSYRPGLLYPYYKRGDIDRAILQYEQLIDPDSNKRGRSLIRPTWHYALANLYEEKGQEAKAVEQYEKFLHIWKNADADRPKLIDAKKRLAKLK